MSASARGDAELGTPLLAAGSMSKPSPPAGDAAAESLLSFEGFDGSIGMYRLTGGLLDADSLDGSPLRAHPELVRQWKEEWKVQLDLALKSLARSRRPYCGLHPMLYCAICLLASSLYVSICLSLGFAIACLNTPPPPGASPIPLCYRANWGTAVGLPIAFLVVRWWYTGHRRPYNERRIAIIKEHMERFVERCNKNNEGISSYYTIVYRPVTKRSQQLVFQPDYIYFVRRQKLEQPPEVFPAHTLAALEGVNQTELRRFKIFGSIPLNAQSLVALEYLPCVGSPQLWHPFMSTLEDLVASKRRADRVMWWAAAAYVVATIYLWWVMPTWMFATWWGWLLQVIYCSVVIFLAVVIIGGILGVKEENYAMLVKERLFHMNKRHWNDPNHIFHYLELDVQPGLIQERNRILVAWRDTGPMAVITSNYCDTDLTGKDRHDTPPYDVQAIPPEEDFERFGEPHYGRSKDLGLRDMLFLPFKSKQEICNIWINERRWLMEQYPAAI